MNVNQKLALEKLLGALVLLAIFGGLAWYSYPAELLSKPLASLSAKDLLGLLGWFGLALLGPTYCVIALIRYEQDRL